MFSVGDVIIYGNTGVCEIVKIDTLKMDGIDSRRLYYSLKPMFSGEVIYTPVDTKVFMRDVITEEKANEIINVIPQIKAVPYTEKSVQMLSDHYKEAFLSHECIDLVKLLMSIYAKKEFLEEQGRKFGQTDERFMKKAEDLLYGEFSIALSLPKDSVEEYISNRVANIQ